MKLVSCVVFLFACAGDGESTTEGRFSLQWAVTVNGAISDCATEGIERVEVVTDNGGTTTETFLCTDGMAVTAPRATGTYTVEVTGLDADDMPVASSADTGIILAGQTIDLGVFPLETATTVCDAASCPTGCCDDSGACIDPQSDTACGRGGVTCADCTAIDQGCNTTDGICVN
jgi:hypothetical protein